MSAPPVTSWICGGCKLPIEWFAERTDCCGKRAVGGYSHVRCAFCDRTQYHLAHWSLWSDGITRRCPCSLGAIEQERWPAQPNPDKSDGLAAAVLALVLDGLWPGIVPVPVSEYAPSVRQGVGDEGGNG